MMNFLFIVLIFYITSSGDHVGVAAQQGDFCGKCSPISGVKCIDETTFAFCDKRGQATNRIAVCPTGFKCVNNVNICIPADRGECILKCGECQNGRFACMTPTSFSLCFGGNQTSKVHARCPLGTLCSTAKFDPNSKNPVVDFCFSEVDLQHSEIDCFKYEAPVYFPPPRPATKPPTIRPTPVQPGRLPHEQPLEIPEQDPNIFCRSQRIGKYQILSDKKCQKYYFCYHNGHYMVGKILQCAEHSVFNPTAQKCVRSSLGFYLLHQCGGYDPRNLSQPQPRIEYTPWISYISPVNTMSPVDYKFAVDEMQRVGHIGYDYKPMNSASEMESGSQPELVQPFHPIIRLNPPMNQRYPLSYIDQSGYMSPLPFPGTYLSPLSQSNPEPVATEPNSYLTDETQLNSNGYDAQSYLDSLTSWSTQETQADSMPMPPNQGKGFIRKSMSRAVIPELGESLDISTYHNPTDQQFDAVQPDAVWFDPVDMMNKWDQRNNMGDVAKPIDVSSDYGQDNTGAKKSWSLY